jgi:hypothetical protein
MIASWPESTSHSLTTWAIHLRRSCVASCAECFPCKAWKTLQVQPIGTDRTVSVKLVKHRESHLYKNVTHVRSQREQHVRCWSSGSCELKFITKNPEPHKFPKFFWLLRMVFLHTFVFKVELDQKKTRWKDARSRYWFVKTASLGSLGKVQLKLERSYDQKKFASRN